MTSPPLSPLTGDITAFDSVIWITNRCVIFGHCLLEWKDYCDVFYVVGKVCFNPKSFLCVTLTF